jgi:hypothetical protein
LLKKLSRSDSDSFDSDDLLSDDQFMKLSAEFLEKLLKQR